MSPPELNVGKKGRRQSQSLGKFPNRQIFTFPQLTDKVTQGLHGPSDVSLHRRPARWQPPRGAVRVRRPAGSSALRRALKAQSTTGASRGQNGPGAWRAYAPWRRPTPPEGAAGRRSDSTGRIDARPELRWHRLGVCAGVTHLAGAVGQPAVEFLLDQGRLFKQPYHLGPDNRVQQVLPRGACRTGDRRGVAIRPIRYSGSSEFSGRSTGPTRERARSRISGNLPVPARGSVRPCAAGRAPCSRAAAPVAGDGRLVDDRRHRNLDPLLARPFVVRRGVRGGNR